MTEGSSASGDEAMIKGIKWFVPIFIMIIVVLEILVSVQIISFDTASTVEASVMIIGLIIITGYSMAKA